MSAESKAGKGMQGISPGKLVLVLLLSLTSGLSAQSRKHPGYQLVDIPLANFNSGITGMDFLPDGRMIITTYRGDTAKAAGGAAFGRANWGQAYILSNIQGDPRNVTCTLVADKFLDAMGVKVVDGKIYIGEINKLIRLADADGDGVFETKETLADLPPDDANLAYSYGPIYKDGYLYMTLGSPVSRSTDRGTVVKIPIEGGPYEVIASGLRSPNGIGWGPDDEIFVTDNQGTWRPASILTHIQPGKFYGFSLGGTRGEVTPPSIHLPYQVFNNSPTQPLYMTSGRYAGQFLYGDWAKLSLFRAFVEKVNGAYQGAAFFFTGGLKSPVDRMVVDEKGVIYLGEMTLAMGPNGPQKLIPQPDAAVFEMMAVRSRKGGLEIEFSQPVGQMANQASFYTVENWYYTPTVNYYNDPQGVAPLTVTAVQVSEDRKRVYLQLDGMTAGKVVHITLGAGLQSQSAQTVWTNDAYYTLNSISDSQPFMTSGIANRDIPMAGPLIRTVSGRLQIQWQGTGFTSLSLQGIQGSSLGTFDVTGLQAFPFPDGLSHRGLLIAKLRGKDALIAAKIMTGMR